MLTWPTTHYIRTYFSFPLWATSEGLTLPAAGEWDQAALLGMSGCCGALSQTAAPPPPGDRTVCPHTEAELHRWPPSPGEVSTVLGTVPPARQSRAVTHIHWHWLADTLLQYRWNLKRLHFSPNAGYNSSVVLFFLLFWVELKQLVGWVEPEGILWLTLALMVVPDFSNIGCIFSSMKAEL